MISNDVPRRFRARVPYSEVAMHLRVAGQVMSMALVGNGMVQLYDEAGREFSFPVTEGEAGIVPAERDYYRRLGGVEEAAS